MKKANENDNFGSTLRMLVHIEEKLREIGIETVTVNSVLAGEATFMVSFDPALLQKYTVQ
jgi:hypothetical protein